MTLLDFGEQPLFYYLSVRRHNLFSYQANCLCALAPSCAGMTGPMAGLYQGDFAITPSQYEQNRFHACYPQRVLVPLSAPVQHKPICGVECQQPVLQLQAGSSESSPSPLSSAGSLAPQAALSTEDALPLYSPPPVIEDRRTNTPTLAATSREGTALYEPPVMHDGLQSYTGDSRASSPVVVMDSPRPARRLPNRLSPTLATRSVLPLSSPSPPDAGGSNLACQFRDLWANRTGDQEMAMGSFFEKLISLMTDVPHYQGPHFTTKTPEEVATTITSVFTILIQARKISLPASLSSIPTIRSSDLADRLLQEVMRVQEFMLISSIRERWINPAGFLRMSVCVGGGVGDGVRRSIASAIITQIVESGRYTVLPGTSYHTPTFDGPSTPDACQQAFLEGILIALSLCLAQSIVPQISPFLILALAADDSDIDGVFSRLSLEDIHDLSPETADFVKPWYQVGKTDPLFKSNKASEYCLEEMYQFLLLNFENVITVSFGCLCVLKAHYSIDWTA